MALSKEAYQALEDIVGPKNISEEPAVLDTYAWMSDNETQHTRSKWLSSHPS